MSDFAKKIRKISMSARTRLIESTRTDIQKCIESAAKAGGLSCAFIHSKYSYSLQHTYRILTDLTQEEILVLKDFVEKDLGLAVELIAEEFDGGRRANIQLIYGFVVNWG